MELGKLTSQKKRFSNFFLRIVFGFLISALLLVGAVFLILLNSESPHSSGGDPLTSEERAFLRPGDILIRQGHGLVSKLIEEQLSEDISISHSALVVQGVQGLGVIHSISSTLSGIDGLQYQDLDQFFTYSQPGSTILIRPRLTENQKNRYLDYAQELLEKKVGFDHSFDLHNPLVLYCSEFLTHILDHVGFWDGENSILVNEKGWILFETFYKNPGFQVLLDRTGLLPEEDLSISFDESTLSTGFSAAD